MSLAVLVMWPWVIIGLFCAFTRTEGEYIYLVWLRNLLDESASVAVEVAVIHLRMGPSVLELLQ